MNVLDAGVLIAHLNSADAHHERSRRVLEALDANLLVSPLTLAEVLTGPARLGRVARAVAGLRRIGVEEVAFPPDCAVRLAELRAETSLKLPDCCVVMAASQTGGALATFDAALAGSARALGLRVEDGT